MKAFVVALLLCVASAQNFPKFPKFPKFPYRQRPQNATRILNPACKPLVGDKEWPSDDVWKKELPLADKQPQSSRVSRPNYIVIAREPKDVVNAVKFAGKYNVRLTIYNSGHDFLGR